MNRGGRFVWIAGVAALVLASGLFAHRVFVSPAGRVILPDARAPWIMAAEPFSNMNRQWGRTRAPRVVFERAFELERVPPVATLDVRVFGAFTVRVNDIVVEFDDDAARRWQEVQSAAVASALRVGANRLRVEVRNPRGPALLSLALSSPPGARDSIHVSSGSGFSASIASRPSEPAVLASDVRRHPGALWLPRPASAVAAHGLALGVVVLVGAALGFGLHRRAGRLPDRAWPRLALAAAGLFWLAMGVVKYPELPLTQGFDARAHLEYVDMLAHGRWPLATDGWSTYHPPLYHAVVAAAGAIGDALGETAGLLARRLPGWLCGLGLVFASGRLARQVHPGRGGLAAAAIGFTAWLPVNVYIAASITNEGLSAFLAASAVVGGSALWSSPRVRARDLVLIASALGLALLTKYTGLIAVAVVGAFTLARIATIDGLDARTRRLRTLQFVAPVVLIPGGHYLRNLIEYGRLLVPNWDLPGAARIWWTAPGFHTPDYYLRFGRVLDEPFYASFASIGDGLYSTFWGDGLLSGAPGLQQLQVSWNLEWMAIGYWAAVPLTALVLTGLVAWFRDLLREADPARRAALALPLVYLAAVQFAIVYATVSLPFAGQGRASYGLSAAPVFAVCFARGLWAVDRSTSGIGRGIARAALGAALCVYAVAVARSFLG